MQSRGLSWDGERPTCSQQLHTVTHVVTAGGNHGGGGGGEWVPGGIGGGGALGLNVDTTDINAKKKEILCRTWAGGGGGDDSKKKKMFLRNTSENRVCMMSMFSFFVLYNNSP